MASKPSPVPSEQPLRRNSMESESGSFVGSLDSRRSSMDEGDKKGAAWWAAKKGGLPKPKPNPAEQFSTWSGWWAA